jgi:hypothetical protein
MSDEVYGRERERRLLELLRALAVRIDALDREGRLLAATPELLRRLGDARSELFHYEVRATYDTPEIAESRRLVDEARRLEEKRLSFDDAEEGDEPWRGRREG